jgi:pyruvate/2-oxoglutarate dehydrogenase complex dihydrolipoamide dehydrogenase (E3) component/uncharacterized membrane protein YdjX (TVP38/TMEM64 family)
MNDRARRWTLIGVVAAGFAAFVAFHGWTWLSFDNLKHQQAWLHDAYERRPLLVAGAFALLYVVVAGLSLPGATILTLAAGAIFGLLPGTAIALVSSTIGASLAFLTARYVLRDAVERRFRTRLETIDRGLARDGAWYLATLRLIAVIPFFVINLVMGLTRMPVRSFALVSLAGMLPGVMVYVNAGTRLGELRSPAGILSPPVLASFAALAALPWLAKGGIAWWKRRATSGRWPPPRSFDHDLAVIGAGSAGLTAAAVAAQLGAKVVLVERERMGGECLNTGCVPSKALIRSARILAQSRRATAWGLRPGAVEADFAEVMAHVRSVVAQVAPHDSRARFESLGVQCRVGAARLVSPYVVAVDGRTETARAIIIATGATPAVPPIPGLREARPLTSDTVWELTALPRRLVVIGGGPVGCELGQCFARFGSQVTIINGALQLLDHEDPDIAARLAERFRAEGIRMVLGERVVHVEPGADGPVVASLGETGLSRHPCDAILVALGKRPATAGLGLEELGIALDGDGRIEVDEHQRTSVPNIYACGDVSSRHRFTHVAADQAWRAAANALLAPLSRQRWNDAAVPWITFTEPEVGRVGLSEAEASRRGIAVDVATCDLADNDRAIVEGEAEGLLKILTAKGSGTILGAAVVGPGAAELVGELTLAITHRIGLDRLVTAVHAYPSLGEAIARAGAAWKRRHTPRWQLSLLAAYVRLRRSTPRTRTAAALAAILLVAVVAAICLAIGAVLPGAAP